MRRLAELVVVGVTLLTVTALSTAAIALSHGHDTRPSVQRGPASVGQLDPSCMASIHVSSSEITYQGQLVATTKGTHDEWYYIDALYERLDAAEKKIIGSTGLSPSLECRERWAIVRVTGTPPRRAIERAIATAAHAGYGVIGPCSDRGSGSPVCMAMRWLSVTRVAVAVGAGLQLQR